MSRAIDVTIRAAAPTDEAPWRRLWHEYCTFYGVQIDDETTSSTWRRLVGPETHVRGHVAEVESTVVGFSTAVIHPTTWAQAECCYLEDLFVDVQARGQGIGRRLIEDLLRQASEHGWARVYWHTRVTNPARNLYDQFAPADDFVRYRVATGELAGLSTRAGQEPRPCAS